MSEDSIRQLIEAEVEKRMAERGTQAPPTETQESMYRVGAVLFIRTVTYHYLGRVTYMNDEELRLDHAWWVVRSPNVDHGELLRTGNGMQKEPYPPSGCTVNRKAIVDVCEWAHDLPDS